MSHNTNLTFGPLINIKITRDNLRRISQVESFFRNNADGFVLSISPSKQEGTFQSVLSNEPEERYFNHTVHYALSHELSQSETTADQKIDFSAWLHQSIQKMIAWARALAISTAYEAIAVEN